MPEWGREQVLVGEVSRGDGRAPRAAAVVVAPGRLRVRFARPLSTTPDPPLDVPLADVTSVVCTTRGWWDVTGGRLTIGCGTGDGVTVAFRFGTNPFAVRRILQALFAGIPGETLVDVDRWCLRPGRRAGRSVLPAIVGAVVLGTAVVAWVYVGYDQVRREAAAARAGTPWASTPGYYRLQGAGGKLPMLGAPWGERCADVVFRFPGHVPDRALHAVTAAVEQARPGMWAGLVPPGASVPEGAGVPLVTGSPEESEAAVHQTPKVVDIFPMDEAPTPGAGMRGDDVAVWAISGSAVNTRFDVMQVKLSEDADAETIRKEMRRLIAHTAGIAYSDRPGSGLRVDPVDSIDGFSAEDLAALRTFSGCPS